MTRTKILKTLLSALLTAFQFFSTAKAGLVDILQSSSVCSTALAANREDVLKSSDYAPINCLSLEQYFQTIENASGYTAHHSFERAIALYNAQRTLKDLTQFLNNQDVVRLQNELNSAFDENLKGLGSFSKFSVLAGFGFPLTTGEQVFFFGVQRKTNNALYVLEGRRNINGTVRLVKYTIQPQNLHVPASPADIALLVNDSQTQQKRYVLLNTISNAISPDAFNDAFKQSDRILGFYLKDMQIIIPIISGMVLKDYKILGNELKFWLNLSGISTQGGSSTSFGEGVPPPSSSYGAYGANDPSDDYRNASERGEQLKVNVAEGLKLRESPNGVAIIQQLNKGQIVYLLNGVNQIVNNGIN